MASWKHELDQAVDRHFDQMVELRRHLHRNPEVSGHERQTSLYLYQMMGDLQFDVRMGPEGRGVITDALFAGPDSPQGLIALRADIDALRIHDEKDVPYRSQQDGTMHACGHDAHTAILAGTLSVLNELSRSGSLPWPVRLRGIFQPSEETARGAREMISVGAMDDVDAILALHVDPTRKLGTIGLRTGVMTANCDEIEFRIIGRGGHAARPHEAHDPIAAAAQLLNGLYLFVPRATDSRDAVVVTIGQVEAGHTANVIPEEVLLRGTVRTLERDVRTSTIQHIQRLAEGIGKTTDTEIHVNSHASTPSVVNDLRMADLIRHVVGEMDDALRIDEIARPSMGSEDFAFYLDCAPGALYRLGSKSDRAGGVPLHNPDFDIDEEALRIGARVMARATIHWAQPGRASLSQETSAATGQ